MASRDDARNSLIEANSSQCQGMAEGAAGGTVETNPFELTSEQV